VDDADLPQHGERPAAERSDRWSWFLRRHQCYSFRGANPSDPEFVRGAVAQDRNSESARPRIVTCSARLRTSPGRPAIRTVTLRLRPGIMHSLTILVVSSSTKQAKDDRHPQSPRKPADLLEG
jgi:hypothetical protein